MTGIRMFCRSCWVEWDLDFETGCTQTLHIHVPLAPEPIVACA
jgi:hypothetical protein